MKLVDFLLARIAKDEAVARAAARATSEEWVAMDSLLMRLRSRPEGNVPDASEFAETVDYRFDDALRLAERFDPARVLAECEAKRRIIGAAFEIARQIDGEWGCCHSTDEIRGGNVLEGCCGPVVAGDFLGPLALVYADHPDYREEWRP